jgi:NitT/TauT family transport system substrate-binding protein
MMKKYFDRMKKGKKQILTILSIILVLGLVTGCAAGTATPAASTVSSSSASVEATPTEQAAYENRTLVRIASLKGPTGMGMVKLFSDNEAKKTANRYEPLIVGAPEEIVAKISSGEIDIAAVPTNLAATLYNKTGGKVQILALNTLGVLNILEKGETVKSIADLKGKTLYASGQGSTPEFILNYLLLQNGIDPKKDITIIYKTEHSELATLALSGQADLIMIPEPFVTTILSKDAGFKSVIDITDEWTMTTRKVGIKDSVLSMGCVIVRLDFAEKNKAAVDAFLTEYEASIRYVNDSSDAAALLIAKYEIMASAELAKIAIPNCNITYIDGEAMKTQIANLYNVFFMADPKSIGGSLPGDDFYYSK